jgi:hypothetical protein
MVDAIIRATLGPSLTPIYDFMLSHMTLVSYVLLVVVAFYFAGFLQLRTIESKTTAMVLDAGKKAITNKPHITSRGIYKQLFPQWEIQIKKWAWFIPHHYDLWPMPVNAATVQRKFNFSPEWISDLLKQNGIHLDEHNGPVDLSTTTFSNHDG